MNIQEVANLAGVSRTTVSRYLNGGYVSAEKKERIRKVIEETGYQPISQAQMLRTKKTGLVGVILPKISSDTVGRMVAGISSVLRAHDYQMLLGNTDNDPDEELKYLALFRENRVDGIIFIATVFTPKHKQLLKECSVPVVILGQRLEGYSSVYQDDYHAAREMTHLLLKNGKKPAYIGVTVRDEAAGLSRKKGFEDAVEECGSVCPPERMLEADFSVASGREKMQLLLQETTDFDCVFCATDSIAAGAMLALKEAGRQIPKDVQIAGIGDTQTAYLMSPRLSTVRFHYQTAGEEAAGILIGAMETGTAVTREIRLGYEVIRMESVIA